MNKSIKFSENFVFQILLYSSSRIFTKEQNSPISRKKQRDIGELFIFWTS